MAIKIFPRSVGSLSLGGGSMAVDISHTDDSIAIGDGTNLLEFIEAAPGVFALPVTVIGGGGAGGGTAATDEATFNSGVTDFTPIGGQYDANESEVLADGQMGMVGLTAARHMKVAVQNSSLAVTGTFWQATQPVSLASVPTHAVTQSGTWNITNISGTVSLPTGAATSANQSTIIGHIDGIETLIGTTNTNTGNAATSLAVIDDWDATAGSAHPTDGVMVMISDGTNARRLLGDSSGRPTVNINGTVPVSGTFWQATQPVSGTVAATQSGTWNIGSITTLPSISLAASSNNIGDVDVLTLPGITGNVAHDSAVSGNPVSVASRALNALPTNVASGDVSYFNVDLAGRTVTQPLSPRELVVKQAATLSNTTETTIVTAAASTYHDLAFLMITNTSSSAVRVDIREDTGASVLFSVGIAANGGAVIPFPTPIPQTATNDNWTAQLSSAVTDVRILALAVKRS